MIRKAPAFVSITHSMGIDHYLEVGAFLPPDHGEVVEEGEAQDRRQVRIYQYQQRCMGVACDEAFAKLLNESAKESEVFPHAAILV